MQKQNQPGLLKTIKQFIKQIQKSQFASPSQEVNIVEKFVLSQIIPLNQSQQSMLAAIKQILIDPDIKNINKYLTLLYLSLIDVTNEKLSDLFKFYYELTSHAIKQFKESKNKVFQSSYWQHLFEKIYQYGMLLLVGSRSLLLNVESLGMRINSQIFAIKAKEARLSRLVKIYNCIFCIPQQFLSLKQSLYLTLIFTRWQISEDDPFDQSFFSNFTMKTRKKLIRKLRNYSQESFNQEHILNLVKIILGGDQLVFSYFLQIKYTYQAIKLDSKSSFKTQRSVFDALKKCPVVRQSRYLFNFIVQLLIQVEDETIIKNIERQSILFVCLRHLSGKFQNNEGLFVILVKHLLHQKNTIISQMSFRFIREEALQYLTVHKVKLLLNVFNIEDWQRIAKNTEINEIMLLNRMERVISLLGGVARRYSQSSLVLYCDPERYAISITNAKNIKSLVVVASFDGVGRLNQNDKLEMKILKINTTKQIYELIIIFSENAQSLKMQANTQAKERTANLIIKCGEKQLVNDRKQYFRFGQSCYQSLITISCLGKDENNLAFCIDGAYYQFQMKKKIQIVDVQIGKMCGSIHTFYALKTDIQLINFYKTWCQCNRKAKYVIQILGTQNITYKLNNRQDSIILNYNPVPTFAFFQSKTEIKLLGVAAVKNITFMDILLQLGGLETIFFIMERFSRSLILFKASQQKINILIANFFNGLRYIATLDESNSFLDDIVNCFKYLNQFLFLLIKRNKMVRQSHNSNLLLSIFEMLVYFRRSKFNRITQTAQAKMVKIQTSLVLQILINFEIWANCSISLQLFVLSQIQFYIKQSVHIDIFIKEDLHRELLSSLILFETSDKHLPHFAQVQGRIIQLCMLLYESSQKYVTSAHDVKDFFRNNSKQKFQSFIERDINSCITYIQFLFKNCRERVFSQSEKNAFELITKYIVDNFVSKRSIFLLIGKVWNMIVSAFSEGITRMIVINKEIIWHSLLAVINIAANDENMDVWIYRCMQNVINNQFTKFNECFWILSKILSKYLFQSSKKRIMISNLILQMKSKVIYRQQHYQDCMQLKEIIENFSCTIIYSLSLYHQFLKLWNNIKTCYFQGIKQVSQNQLKKKERQKGQDIKYEQFQIKLHESDKNLTEQQQIFKNQLKIWIFINEFFLQILYKQKKINNINKQFVKTLVINKYQYDPKHQLVMMPLSQLLLELHTIRQLARQSHNKIQNKYTQYGLMSAYALIQHCQCWPIMYFLLENGLITVQKDIMIPFKSTEMQQICQIGGTLSYYLSTNPSPIELYVIFIIILHRNLSNTISLLSTQSTISLFQYSIQYLLFNFKGNIQSEQQSNQVKKVWLNTGLLIIMLKQILKSLNGSFINKVSTISKDLQKLMGSPSTKKSELVDWKKKKPSQMMDNLSKSSYKIQVSLQDSKIDKDMMMFIQIISSKLTLINEKDGKAQILSIVAGMVSDIKTKNWPFSEQQLKKLNVLGIRLFQIAREYFLSINHQYIFVKYPLGKQNDIPQISVRQAQIFANYIELLTEKFDNILDYYNDRGKQSQQYWQNLLITNQHWFNLQEDVDDVTTKFYELDQKQTGPFGLYKLNIRPVRSDHQKLPYPRKKQLLEMKSKKEQQEREQQSSIFNQRLTLQLNNLTLYSSLYQTAEKQKSISRVTIKEQQNIKVMKKKEYYCEYVTKRGVYAGILYKKKGYIEFCFTGYDKLPTEKEYQTSTNKCHRIQVLSDWQQKEIKHIKIHFNGAKVFTRRYILRHTAFEVFHQIKHKSYFFNLFFKDHLQNFISELKSDGADVVDKRVESFQKQRFTERWRKGEISNFQYICLINRYSGRTYNDLVQYPVLPWVVTNFDGKGGYKEIDKQFYKEPKNMRDLSLPTGKLDSGKFNKLKARLRQVDASDRQIRFLYGTMYSNPTVLYNFFIRLEPYTSLHWQHQGRKIDHADRLFSGIAEQFATILTSSSDMKQLAPEFYYWTQFLRNRNKIELGKKQKGQEVDAVVLPVWARTPEEFIFKMREMLQSNYVSMQLHLWIDLIFGYKAPLNVAEEYDNLYHYQCYEHDLFEAYETENQMKIAQITISQFGQVPEQIFFKEHLPRYTRRQIDIDMGVIIHKGKNIQEFQHNQAGIMIWSQDYIVFKKVAIPQLYNSFEWNKQFQNKNKYCILMSVNLLKWLGLNQGVLRVIQKNKIKMEKSIQAKCLDVMGNYIFYSIGSKIVILKIVREMFEVYSTLYGHRDEIILIKTDHLLDVIVSVDRSGYVLVHELTELRFLRAFQLGCDFEGQQSSKLRSCIHRMGYFIFLDHDQTLWIFNYMGELIIEQDIQVKAADSKHEEQRITQIQIFSQQHSQLLMASSKGSIFLVNFLDIIRFKEIYPFKTYSRLGRNILSGVRSKGLEEVNGKAIKQFSLTKTVGQTSTIYQILVLYESDQLICYTEQRQMGLQLRTNQRLKTMGFF